MSAAESQTEDEGRAPRRRAMKIFWWVVGVLLVVGFLLLSLPIYGNMTPRAYRTKLLSNAKQVALACRMYAEDHDGMAPAGLDQLVAKGILTAERYQGLLNEKWQGLPEGELEYLLGPGVSLADLPPDAPILRWVFDEQSTIVVTADYRGFIEEE